MAIKTKQSSHVRKILKVECNFAHISIVLESLWRGTFYFYFITLLITLRTFFLEDDGIYQTLLKVTFVSHTVGSIKAIYSLFLYV